MFAGFWTDWLWYRSVNYSSVFTTTLWTKIGLFFVFGLLMAVAVGVNIWLAHRLRPPLSAMSVEQQSLDRYRMGIAPYKKWLLIGDHRAGRPDRRRLRLRASGAPGCMWVNGVPFGTEGPAVPPGRRRSTPSTCPGTASCSASASPPRSCRLIAAALDALPVRRAAADQPRRAGHRRRPPGTCRCCWASSSR